jgi:hypothetical protein
LRMGTPGQGGVQQRRAGAADHRDGGGGGRRERRGARAVRPGRDGAANSRRSRDARRASSALARERGARPGGRLESDVGSWRSGADEGLDSDPAFEPESEEASEGEEGEEEEGAGAGPGGELWARMNTLFVEKIVSLAHEEAAHPDRRGALLATVLIVNPAGAARHTHRPAQRPASPCLLLGHGCILTGIYLCHPCSCPESQPCLPPATATTPPVG